MGDWKWWGQALERERGREAIFVEAQDKVSFSHVSFILCDRSAGQGLLVRHSRWGNWSSEVLLDLPKVAEWQQSPDSKPGVPGSTAHSCFCPWSCHLVPGLTASGKWPQFFLWLAVWPCTCGSPLWVSVSSSIKCGGGCGHLQGPLNSEPLSLWQSRSKTQTKADHLLTPALGSPRERAKSLLLCLWPSLTPPPVLSTLIGLLALDRDLPSSWLPVSPHPPHLL